MVLDTIDSEQLIIELNNMNDVVDERRGDTAFSSHAMFELLPETVADKRTLQAVEIHDLYTSLNHTITDVGSARLFHSLMNPSESIELIHAKHDAYCELESNQRLQDGIAEYLHAFRQGEAHLFRVLNGHLTSLMPYGDYKKAINSIKIMQEAVDRIPQPETIYLDSLIKNIQSFQGSPVSDMVRGPILRTIAGVKAKSEKEGWTPSMNFRPTRFGPGTLVPFAPGLSFGAAWFFGLMDPVMAEGMFLMTSWVSLLGMLYGAVFKPMFDFETAILPVRKRLLDSNRFASAIESVAAIDEILSFIKFGQAMPHATVMPEVTNHASHYFEAKEMCNPVLAKNDKDFVANDLELKENKLTFVTGPNSGGKTTFCKTIVQNQLLGQIGAPVVARQAKMNMADKIVYQAPAFDSLNDPEGRFGTELKVTRDIFYSVTPRSLAILDEIAEGTTAHEKVSFSVDILKGFHAIGNSTVLVTHSFEMVEYFEKIGMGKNLQVEFHNEKPTHRIIEGISKESHAYRVARKIGFSPENIKAYLQDKGYWSTSED